MKTYIKDMTSEQLEKVITENENLQNKVATVMQDCEGAYIDEILETLSVTGYHIDPFSYSYIHYSNLYDFASGVLDAQKGYNIFGMDKDNYVSRLNKLLDDEKECTDSDDSIAIYDRLGELLDEIKEVITEFLKACLTFDILDIIEAFKENYNELFETHYIKNDDYKKLYELTENVI